MMMTSAIRFGFFWYGLRFGFCTFTQLVLVGNEKQRENRFETFDFRLKHVTAERFGNM